MGAGPADGSSGATGGASASRVVRIVDPEGLHARPCAAIAREAQRFRSRVVLVHGVRHARDLTYSKLLDELKTSKRLIRVACVSRERAPDTLEGRIPPALVDGRLERAAGIALTPESSRVLLCGNPAMIQDMLAILTDRGLMRHRRREPGHIVVEGFW